MHIPEPLLAYKKLTLLVVADGEKALFFSLHGRNAEPVGEIDIDYPPKDNLERTSTMTPSGMHSAEQSENLGMEKERRFSHILAKELLQRLQQDTYEELILTAPHEHLNEFTKALHNDVRKRLVDTIPKLLTKEPLPEILERIQKIN
ncbi:MAG: hypothetical protein UT30_C0010G0024 [Candidatus Uhrbacteria bacterium GW2011_GWF2_39_13]|uniref:Host attachment protein n=1 Tax=Candidatus Uhrbacteria bacterium GW2011_GWF2_39_13 TaxID=1618995 RepID=A0A0G0Q1G5_9BACT|nr:MAG: hypothetical protein UT30_C0010G0024 [Candidatus Uhrbacteria bacterium GW2011_GWF2_39_13]HAU65804.1 hypothetical protein [Candidatus Uhrbacteria bacterium]